MVTNPTLDLKMSQQVYEEDLEKTSDMPALHFVDFYFLPHLNSQYFKKLTIENIEEVIKGFGKKIYAVDDEGALKVVDGVSKVVSEGVWKEWN